MALAFVDGVRAAALTEATTLAADFDGAAPDGLNSSAAALDRPASQGDFMFEVWVRPDATGIQHVLGQWGGGAGSRNYRLFITSGNRFRLEINVTAGGNRVITNTSVTVSAGTTYHVVCWAEPLNGDVSVQVDAGTVATDDGSAFTAENLNEVFSVGEDLSGSSNDFDGLIWRIRRWDRAPDVGEVAALYNGGHGLAYDDFTAANLVDIVGAWELDEFSSGAGPITRVDSHSTNDLTDSTNVPSGTRAFDGETAQDFVVSSTTDTPKGAMVVVSRALVNDTITAEFAMCIGVTDGTFEGGYSNQQKDNVGTTDTNLSGFDDAVVRLLNADGDPLDADHLAIGSFDSWVDGGIRIMWDNIPDDAYLVHVTLWFGENVDVAAGTTTPTSTTVEEQITTGFKTDHVISLTSIGQSLTEGSRTYCDVQISHTVRENPASNIPKTRHFGWMSTPAVATTRQGILINADDQVASTWIVQASTPFTKLRGTDIDDFHTTDGFNTIITSPHTTGTQIVYLAIGYGGNSIALEQQRGATSTGVVGYEPPFRPWACWSVVTPADDTNFDGDQNGADGASFGIGFKGPSAEWCVGGQNEDNVGTTNANSFTKDSIVSILEDDASGVLEEGDGTFTGDGIDIDWTAVPGSGSGRQFYVVLLEVDILDIDFDVTQASPTVDIDLDLEFPLSFDIAQGAPTTDVDLGLDFPVSFNATQGAPTTSATLGLDFPVSFDATQGAPTTAVTLGIDFPLTFDITQGAPTTAVSLNLDFPLTFDATQASPSTVFVLGADFPLAFDATQGAPTVSITTGLDFPLTFDAAQSSPTTAASLVLDFPLTFAAAQGAPSPSATLGLDFPLTFDATQGVATVDVDLGIDFDLTFDATQGAPATAFTLFTEGLTFDATQSPATVSITIGLDFPLTFDVTQGAASPMFMLGDPNLGTRTCLVGSYMLRTSVAGSYVLRTDLVGSYVLRGLVAGSYDLRSSLLGSYSLRTQLAGERKTC